MCFNILASFATVGGVDVFVDVLRIFSFPALLILSLLSFFAATVSDDSLVDPLDGKLSLKK